MIAGIDIETAGLDATKFVYGCLKQANRKKPEFFTTKEQLWQRVKELGRKAHKRNKTLAIYSHNAQYDFYGYADLTDPHIHIFCTRPFIASYKIDGREAIKFLDTLSLFKMPLKELGDIVNLPKLDLPEELLNEDTTLTPALARDIQPYIERDVDIMLTGLQLLQDLLATNNISVRRLITINQIALNALLTYIRTHEPHDHFFYKPQYNQTHTTFRRNEIHRAYRGGRNDVFTTGRFEDVTHIDINSLYPFSALTIDFPELPSERKHWRPTPAEWASYKQHIGVSKALVYNNTNTIGVLPVRTSHGNHYPTAGTYLIGVWTHDELRTAEQEGYTILSVEWSVTYKHGHNVLFNYMRHLYTAKQQAPNAFTRYFYKSLLNNCLGKLAQYRTDHVITADSVEEAEAYLKKNYDILQAHDLTYLYGKESYGKPKHYYSPIIPTLVNARARLILYHHMKQIPEHDLLYTDTDSILFTGNHLHKFVIGDGIGNFKIEAEHEPCIIYGKKTYAIGEHLKISGIRKRGITLDDFSSGTIPDTKMHTIHTAQDLGNVGTFYTTVRDLHKLNKDFLNVQALFDSQDLFIDSDTHNIAYFLPILEELLIHR